MIPFNKMRRSTQSFFLRRCAQCPNPQLFAERSRSDAISLISRRINSGSATAFRIGSPPASAPVFRLP